LMIDPAENLCKANRILTRLNTALRDRNKEDHLDIEMLCLELRDEIN
jgi:hypothetical protein